MCFAAGTQLLLLDGRSHSIESLAASGESFVVYSCTPTGRVLASYARALQSESCTCRVVTLDSGDTIVAARSQQVMSRTGIYCEMSALRAGNSVMPLYTKQDKDGYTLVQQNYSGRWQKAHWIVARSGLLGPIPKFERQRTVIHHRNFNPSDNRPCNLGFMGGNDHSAFHRSLVERNEHWQSPEFEARRVAALARKAQTPEGHAYFAARGTKNIVRYMTEQREKFLAAVAGNGRRGAPVLAEYNRSEKARSRSRKAANTLYECETCGEFVKSYIGLHNHRRWRHGYNHKVVSAKTEKQPRPVYCIATSYGNFALAAGVFVRACKPLAETDNSLVAIDPGIA